MRFRNKISNFVIIVIYLFYIGKDLFMFIIVITVRVLVFFLLWILLGFILGGRGLGGCIYVEFF